MVQTRARASGTSSRPAVSGSVTNGKTTSARFRSRHPRKAQPKTYPVDDSSDEDEINSGTDASSNSPSDTDSEDEIASYQGSPVPQRSRRSTRQSDLASRAANEAPRVLKNRIFQQIVQSSLSKFQRKETQHGAQLPTRSRKSARSLESPTKRQRKASPAPEQPPGGIPNWLTPEISYDIWRDIFFHAASDEGTTIVNTSWLWRSATVCQAFKESALAALYSSPELKTANKARRFVSTLQIDPSQTTIHYRSKVTSLLLDISIIPQAIYFDLISLLPALRDLIVYTPLDQPPYRSLDATVRWSYGKDIFEALTALPHPDGSSHGRVAKQASTVLKSWEWSARLMDFPLENLAKMHQQPSFAHLTKVGFVNFQVPSLKLPPPAEDDEEMATEQYRADGAAIEPVANAIAELKYLKHLTFESSTMMNHRLLPLLPSHLTHLDLINCWEVRSEDFAPFLCTHGQQLRSLNLISCQSLDLGFLTKLAKACPKLEGLNMNMSYYRHHESIDDDDPMYETALEPDSIPAWPSGLRKLQIEHVRRWSSEAATNLLQSLVDQAESLMDLRYVVIKTILDIPWQARATMRKEWRSKLEKAFLRPHVQPAHNSTLQGNNSVPTAEREQADVTPRKRRRISDAPSRRSGRLASQDSHPDNDDDDDDDGIEVPFVQGRCHTVSITFDNQKPREMQYGMQDFLSEESGSGEEWTSDREDEDFTVF